MKTNQKSLAGAVAMAVLLGMVGCADMTTQQKDTAIGAGAGALVGGVLTGGSTLGVVGGAAVGGVVGHEVGRNK
jgi:osmotically inducible lipoprotein OsmB